MSDLENRSFRDSDDLGEYVTVWGIVKDALPILLITLIGSLVAGVVLGGMENSLEKIPGLIAVIPAMLDLRGNIYGAFGSRLSTGLHQGVIEVFSIRDKNIGNAVAVSLFNSSLVSVFLGLIAWGFLSALGLFVISLFKLVLITFLAGVFSGLVLTFGVLLAVFFSYRWGLDPDNVVGPVVTITGDVFSILILFYVAKIVTGVF